MSPSTWFDDLPVLGKLPPAQADGFRTEGARAPAGQDDADQLQRLGVCRGGLKPAPTRGSGPCRGNQGNHWRLQGSGDRDTVAQADSFRAQGAGARAGQDDAGQV